MVILVQYKLYNKIKKHDIGAILNNTVTLHSDGLPASCRNRHIIITLLVSKLECIFYKYFTTSPYCI